MSTAVVCTCEHATPAVPPELRAPLRGAARALASHRGWDPGAAPLARALAAELRAPLLLGRASRLVVDLNRTPPNPRLWSEWSRALHPAERARLLREIHAPWRAELERRVRAGLRGAGRVLHLSIHSFTPVLRGRRRAMHVGLLYDPRRAPERALALRLRRALRAARPELRVSLNRPYSGRADGSTSDLRRRWPAARYLGLEIETRNDLLTAPGAARDFARLYAAALRAALLNPGGPG